MPDMWISIHLTKPHTSDYDILTHEQTLSSAMDYFHREKADKVTVETQHGRLVLNPNGTWAFHSKEMVLHKENLP